MSESRPTASVLVTGSELLTGHVADANGPFVARSLGELGFAVSRVLLVGDRAEDLRSALEFVASDDLVVTSGGLGPTADDLTAEVVAEFAGAEMEVDTALQGRIHDRAAGWASRAGWAGPALDAATAKQARVPRGASVLRASSNRSGPRRDWPSRGRAGRSSSCSRGRRGSCRACGPPRWSRRRWRSC